MNYLAIDTSGSHLTVVASGKEKSVRFTGDCKLKHSVVLMDEIEKCLEEAQISSDEIDVFACAVGPGSFTGIRIGVSTIKAFAYVHKARVLSVPSFMPLAYNVKSNGKKLAVIDAGHDNYYVCGYDCDNKIVIPPTFLDRKAVEFIADDFTIISSTEIGFNERHADICQGFVDYVEANLDSATYDAESLVPLYIRKSQAEENEK